MFPSAFYKASLLLLGLFPFLAPASAETQDIDVDRVKDRLTDTSFIFGDYFSLEALLDYRETGRKELQ